MDISVCLLAFNRPDTTRLVFERIAEVQPSRLFVVTDGPRPGNADDEQKCAEVARIVQGVDWPCVVETNAAPKNLGLRRRVVSGLDWLFERTEQAVILEDDCLPDPTFFRFCEELLDRYQDDERIMSISGNNFQGTQGMRDESYYFSRFPHIWGWATWRRAWALYDGDMSPWPSLQATPWLKDVLGRDDAVDYWRAIFDDPATAKTWDYQWVFSCWLAHGLTVLPDVNLVTNIGWREDATHTTALDHPLANLPSSALPFPLQHPKDVHPDRLADDYTMDEVFGLRRKSLATRARGRLRGLLR